MDVENSERLSGLFEGIRGLRGSVEGLPKRAELCREALELVSRDDQPKLWAGLHLEWGLCLAQMRAGDPNRNVEEAIGLFDQALQVFTRSDYPEQWASTQQNLGACYRRRIQGDREENQEAALRCYTNALTVFQDEAYSEDRADVRFNLVNLYLERIRGAQQDNLEEAFACYEKAWEVRTREADPVPWTQTAHNLAVALVETQAGDRAQNIERGIKLFREVLEVRPAEAFAKERAKTLSNMANAFLRRVRGDRAENLELAIRTYGQAIALLEAEGAPEELGQAHLNLAVAYRERIRGERLENLMQAAEHLEEARTVFQKEALLPRWATAQTNLADLYWYLGALLKVLDRKKAAPYFEQALGCCTEALKVYTRSSYPGKWALVQYNRGNIYSDRPSGDRGKNQELAIKCYEASLQERPEDTQPFERAQTFNNLAVTYWERQRGVREDNLAQAIDLYGQAIQLYRKLGVRGEERRSLAGLARLYHGMDDWQTAYDTLGDALQVVECIRSDALGDLGQVDIAEENEQLYDLMVDTCLHLGGEAYATAFEAVEANKARSFLAQMGYEGIPPPPVSKEVEELVQKERTLVHELGGYEGRIRQAASADERLRLIERQDGVRIALNDIWAQLEPEVPEYVALRRGEPIRYGDVQALLDGAMPQGAVVSFYSQPDRLLAFVLRAGQQRPEVVQEPVSEEQLRKGTLGGVGRLLDKALIHLEGAEMVYLIPHRWLHRLPLHALEDNEPFLMERFPIAYAPSAGVLSRLIRGETGADRADPPEVLVVGNPTLDLVHADNEARQVARFFGVSPFLGSRASKATLLPWLVDADIIHLACHGKFDPDRPMQSGVVFAKKETWTAREIMGQRLRARLVVLSACETGQSEVDRGDELVGLTRAFLHAGASSVIVSLWEVHDASTAALMTDFYQRLMDRDGHRLKPVAVALKEAMLALKETRGAPDLWAPFILVGDGR